MLHWCKNSSGWHLYLKWHYVVCPQNHTVINYYPNTAMCNMFSQIWYYPSTYLPKYKQKGNYMLDHPATVLHPCTQKFNYLIVICVRRSGGAHSTPAEVLHLSHRRADHPLMMICSEWKSALILIKRKKKKQWESSFPSPIPSNAELEHTRAHRKHTCWDLRDKPPSPIY